jgi:hypothetical protein
MSETNRVAGKPARRLLVALQDFVMVNLGLVILSGERATPYALLRTTGLTDDASFPHIAEAAALAGPRPAIGESQLDSGKVARVCQPHIDAHQAILAEPCNGALGQDKMGRRTALPAEVDLRVGIDLVVPAISLRRAFDIHLRRMKVAPARSGLAAERAVALVDVVGLLVDLNVDLAAKAGKLDHPQLVAWTTPAR